MSHPTLGEGSPWSVAATGVHEIEHGGRAWRVSVAEPLLPGDGLRRVLYVLDPLGTFGITVHVLRSLELLCAGHLPRLLVVGVGPASDNPAEVLAQRFHDLTPGPPSDADTYAAMGLTFGGAEAMLDLLLDVIAPAVEQQYDGDPSDRTLAGWSLGGLLVAHALLTRPADLRRYLLVSPSLWWADAQVLRRVGDLAGHRDALDVYVSTAEHEQGDVARMWPPVPDGPGREAVSQQVAANAMTTNAQSFVRQLRALELPALTVHDEVLAGEHHNTTWAAAVTRGVLALHASSHRLGS